MDMSDRHEHERRALASHQDPAMHAHHPSSLMVAPFCSLRSCSSTFFDAGSARDRENPGLQWNDQSWKAQTAQWQALLSLTPTACGPTLPKRRSSVLPRTSFRVECTGQRVHARPWAVVQVACTARAPSHAEARRIRKGRHTCM
jgi:hypothetical protein